MFNKFFCSCGQQLHAWEGMTRVRCPACGKMLETSAVDAKGFVVFGLYPREEPAAPQVELKYQVVQVAEERVPPVRSEPPQRPVYNDDDEDRTYQVVEVPRENGQKSQEEMWAPDADVRPAWRRHRPPHKYRRFRSNWPLERYAIECLLYPIRACPLFGGLGFVLAFAFFGAVQVLRNGGPGAWLFVPVWLAVFAYCCGFLTCVLRSGVCGETMNVRWPAADVRLVAQSLLAAVLSFLAGPALLVAIAAEYWVEAGQLDAIDAVILFELMMVATGWWFFSFVSVSRNHRWADLHPRVVLQRAYQLGYRALVAVGLVCGFALFHGFFAVVGLASHGTGADLVLLMFCSISFLFWMTFLLRWVGVSIHKSQPKMAREKKPRNLVDSREAKALDCRWIDC